MNVRPSWWCALAIVAATRMAAAAELPENLAAKATVSATSEYNARYLAKFACNGKIPAAHSQADLDGAWCVLRASLGDKADFTLTWSEAVDVAEIVYFGRTAWMPTECWKDYEVHAGDGAADSQPIARGSLKAVHGPQRIALPALRTARLTLRFLNSHGGANPGASEIMVFAQKADDKALAKLVGNADVPGNVDEVDPVALAELIDALDALHGPRYAKAAEHRAQLAALNDGAAAAIALQRDVLLFDVDRLVAIKRHEINASHVYTYHYEGQRDGGGLYLLSAHDAESQPVELVASPDGQILDCDLSHDGRRILFSWRRGADAGYHVWMIGVDGSGLRQLTDGEWHDYNACWLPDGGIAFLSTRHPQFAYCWHAPVGVLYRMDADGGNPRRLSANYLNDFTPAVLDDGRILYTRWEYVDRPAIPIQSLWTVNPDGTNLTGFFGNRVLSPGTFMEARSVPGTGKIICTMTGHNGPTRGAIGLIDRSRGVNSQDAIENLTPDTPIAPVDKGDGNTAGSKPYSGPYPLDSVRFLVSARGPLLVRTLDGRCQSTVLAAPGDRMQWFAAQPVRPRAVPPAIPSQLPADAADGDFATVVLQDVYNGLTPQVARGEVKAIRIVRELHKPLRIDPSLRAFGFQFPVISCGATYAAKQVLGEAPVEADGSACFRVPAGVPVYFMALDGEGRAMQRMRSFTHFMPGETQGCVGCHEHRLSAARPQPSAAANLLPRRPAPAEWGLDGFDYARIVQPVLDRHCGQCHTGIEPAGGVDLSGGKTDFFNVSYETLARQQQGRRGTKYVSWIPTYNGQEWNILDVAPKAWGSPQSRLAEIVLGGHPDEDGKSRVALDAGDRRRVLAWIDLNVPYYGTSETAYPERPGCRQIVPDGLDALLSDVGRRRCAECHAEGKFPRREWVRITEPELNPFLVAPLARAAGGSQRCGRAVFPDRDDADYKAILSLFAPVADMLEKNPRMDMPGAQPSPEVNRCCR
jgi:hypothetical protein